MLDQQLKVVLDTNLFVAAYWNRRSASARIIEACLSGHLQVYYTSEVERELWLIMRNIRARDEFRATVSNLIGRAEQVSAQAKVDVRTEDPEDQKFLECAVSANADYLITSDDHLLRLRKTGKTVIIKPGDFWREIICSQRNS
ncbi:MAG: putative toxin-antitoxin system toxin component, PIN family [Armatimonadetes bacterium]|nr:putative toxin-antitoxin system toxin component, PIN family [Armatimonadota bacterium]